MKKSLAVTIALSLFLTSPGLNFYQAWASVRVGNPGASFKGSLAGQSGARSGSLPVRQTGAQTSAQFAAPAAFTPPSAPERLLLPDFSLEVAPKPQLLKAIEEATDPNPGKTSESRSAASGKIQAMVEGERDINADDSILAAHVPAHASIPLYNPKSDVSAVTGPPAVKASKVSDPLRSQELRAKEDSSQSRWTVPLASALMLLPASSFAAGPASLYNSVIFQSALVLSLTVVLGAMTVGAVLFVKNKIDSLWPKVNPTTVAGAVLGAAAGFGLFSSNPSQAFQVLIPAGFAGAAGGMLSFIRLVPDGKNGAGEFGHVLAYSAIAGFFGLIVGMDLSLPGMIYTALAGAASSGLLAWTREKTDDPLPIGKMFVSALVGNVIAYTLPVWLGGLLGKSLSASKKNFSSRSPGSKGQAILPLIFALAGLAPSPAQAFMVEISPAQALWISFLLIGVPSLLAAGGAAAGTLAGHLAGKAFVTKKTGIRVLGSLIGGIGAIGALNAWGPWSEMPGGLAALTAIAAASTALAANLYMARKAPSASKTGESSFYVFQAKLRNALSNLERRMNYAGPRWIMYKELARKLVDEKRWFMISLYSGMQIPILDAVKYLAEVKDTESIPRLKELWEKYTGGISRGPRTYQWGEFTVTNSYGPADYVPHYVQNETAQALLRLLPEAEAGEFARTALENKLYTLDSWTARNLLRFVMERGQSELAPLLLSLARSLQKGLERNGWRSYDTLYKFQDLAHAAYKLSADASIKEEALKMLVDNYNSRENGDNILRPTVARLLSDIINGLSTEAAHQVILRLDKERYEKDAGHEHFGYLGKAPKRERRDLGSKGQGILPLITAVAGAGLMLEAFAYAAAIPFHLAPAVFILGASLLALSARLNGVDLRPGMNPIEAPPDAPKTPADLKPAQPVPNRPAAKETFRQAVKHYFGAEGVLRNYEKAAKLFQRAALSRVSSKLERMAAFYFLGELNRRRELKKWSWINAYSFYLLAAQLENSIGAAPGFADLAITSSGDIRLSHLPDPSGDQKILATIYLHAINSAIDKLEERLDVEKISNAQEEAERALLRLNRHLNPDSDSSKGQAILPLIFAVAGAGVLIGAAAMAAKGAVLVPVLLAVAGLELLGVAALRSLDSADSNKSPSIFKNLSLSLKRMPPAREMIHPLSALQGYLSLWLGVLGMLYATAYYALKWESLQTQNEKPAVTVLKMGNFLAGSLLASLHIMIQFSDRFRHPAGVPVMAILPLLFSMMGDYSRFSRDKNNKSQEQKRRNNGSRGHASDRYWCPEGHSVMSSHCPDHKIKAEKIEIDAAGKIPAEWNPHWCPKGHTVMSSQCPVHKIQAEKIKQ